MPSRFKKPKIKRSNPKELDKISKRVKGKAFVEVGIIKGEPKEVRRGGKIEIEAAISTAEVAYYNEFGAEINHPGGTPYIIVEGGKAVFVKKGTPGIVGVTKPHKIVIPERPFFRSTIKEEKKNLQKLRVDLSKKMVAGKRDLNSSLSLLGDHLAQKIREKIVELKSPGNAASTKRKKGSSNPLYDTGQMAQSITYAVKNGKPK